MKVTYCMLKHCLPNSVAAFSRCNESGPSKLPVLKKRSKVMVIKYLLVSDHFSALVLFKYVYYQTLFVGIPNCKTSNYPVLCSELNCWLS